MDQGNMSSQCMTAGAVGRGHVRSCGKRISHLRLPCPRRLNTMTHPQGPERLQRLGANGLGGAGQGHSGERGGGQGRRREGRGVRAQWLAGGG